MRRLDTLRDLVAKFIDESRERQAKYYNKGKKDVSFQIGDEVMRRVHILSDASKRFNAKLAPKFEGPFIIKEILSPTVYTLEPLEGKIEGSPKLICPRLSAMFHRDHVNLHEPRLKFF